MILLYELREKAKEIRGFEGDAEAAKRSMALAAQTLLDCVNVARKEGLLMLEETFYEFKADFSCQAALKDMIMLIVDGTEPELVKDISMQKYFIENLQAYEGLEYLMLLTGVLGIQAGENPKLIDKKIRQFLPEEVEAMMEEVEAVTAFRDEYRTMEEIMVENVRKRQYQWDLKDEGYFHAKLLDYVFENMSDRGIQRVLRDIDNMDLAISMRGMSLISKERIFQNVSQRLGTVIASEMQKIGGVKFEKLQQINKDILFKVIKLHIAGEIAEPGFTVLEAFFNMIEPEATTTKNADGRIRYEHLRKLLKDYESIHFTRV